MGSFLELCEKVRFDDHYAETVGRYHPPLAAGLFQKACYSLSLSHKSKWIIRSLFLLSTLTPGGAQCVIELSLCPVLTEGGNQGRTMRHKELCFPLSGHRSRWQLVGGLVCPKAWAVNVRMHRRRPGSSWYRLAWISQGPGAYIVSPEVTQRVLYREKVL